MWAKVLILWWDKSRWHSASRLRKGLGGLVPGWLLDKALMQLLPPTYSQLGPAQTTLPTDSTFGRSKKVPCTGHYVLEGEVLLPRLVRTKDGRVLLQHQLIREREASNVTTPAAG